MMRGASEQDIEKYKLYCLGTSELSSIVIPKVEHLIVKYRKEYGDRPKFIKIPIYVYDCMKFGWGIYTDNLQSDSPEVLCGLRVCPTVSIQSIDEIEVF